MVMCELCGAVEAEDSVTFLEERMIYWMCPSCISKIKEKVNVEERKTPSGEISLYVK